MQLVHRNRGLPCMIERCDNFSTDPREKFCTVASFFSTPEKTLKYEIRPANASDFVLLVFVDIAVILTAIVWLEPEAGAIPPPSVRLRFWFRLLTARLQFFTKLRLPAPREEVYTLELRMRTRMFRPTLYGGNMPKILISLSLSKGENHVSDSQDEKGGLHAD